MGQHSTEPSRCENKEGEIGYQHTQFSDGLLKALIHPDPPTQGAVAWGARIVKPEGPVVFEDVLPFLNLWPLFHLLGSIRETLLKQAHLDTQRWRISRRSF